MKINFEPVKTDDGKITSAFGFKTSEDFSEIFNEFLNLIMDNEDDSLIGATKNVMEANEGKYDNVMLTLAFMHINKIIQDFTKNLDA